MFGWSISILFMKLIATVPIIGIFTKTSISIFLKRLCLIMALTGILVCIINYVQS